MGGKKGTYCGRGMKGQRSRSGRNFPPAIREMIKRYPKLRGYKFKPVNTVYNVAVLNLSVIDKNFKEGEKVNAQVLSEKGLVRNIRGKIPQIKILSAGEIKKALVFENCLVSKAAKEKIEKAGGKI